MSRGRAPNRAEAEEGMQAKAEEFKALGGEIYLSEDGTVREPIDWRGRGACTLGTCAIWGARRVFAGLGVSRDY